MFSDLESLRYNNKVVTGPRTGFNLARPKVPIAFIDKGDLARAGLIHTRSRDHQLASQRQVELYIYEHPEGKLHAGVWNREPHFSGARGWIQLRRNEADPSRECASRIRVHGDGRRIS